MSARDILDFSDRFHPLTQHMVADRDVIQVATALVRCGVAPNLVAGIVAELTVNVPSDDRENRMGPPLSGAERQRRYRLRKKQALRDRSLSPIVGVTANDAKQASPVAPPADVFPEENIPDFDDSIGDDVMGSDVEQRNERSVTQDQPNPDPSPSLSSKNKESLPHTPSKKQKPNSPSPIPSVSLRSTGPDVSGPENTVTKIERDLLGGKLEKPEKPDAIVFKLARVIFGKKHGGGLAKKVLDATKNNIPAALEILGEAKRAGDPPSYLAGILNRLAVPDDDTIRPGFEMLPYDRMTLAERHQIDRNF